MVKRERERERESIGDIESVITELVEGIRPWSLMKIHFNPGESGRKGNLA